MGKKDKKIKDKAKVEESSEAVEEQEETAEDAAGNADVETESAESDTPGSQGETRQGEEAEGEEDLAGKLLEMTNRYMRAKADMENYRKRVQREFGEIRETTKMTTVSDFLSVYDHFQMAMQHAGQNADFDTLKTGMEMIQSEFRKALENLGIKPVNAENQEFDPNEHEAVAQEPSADVPAGHVLRQWKCGYRMGEKLIRPATVVVSSGEDESEKQSD